MCMRNSPDLKKERKEASMGCVRETPHIKMKPVEDVQKKLPTEELSQCGMCKRKKEKKKKEKRKEKKPAQDV